MGRVGDLRQSEVFRVIFIDESCHRSDPFLRTEFRAGKPPDGELPSDAAVSSARQYRYHCARTAHGQIPVHFESGKPVSGGPPSPDATEPNPAEVHDTAPDRTARDEHIFGRPHLSAAR